MSLKVAPILNLRRKFGNFVRWDLNDFAVLPDGKGLFADFVFGNDVSDGIPHRADRLIK